jgi:multicomponent Na+:H+ antiporter subunit D
MTPSFLVFAPVLVPMAAALGAMALARHLVAQRILAIVGSGLTFLLAIVLVMEVDKHHILSVTAGMWKAPYGIAFTVDRLGAIMTCVSCLIAFAVSIYSWKDISDELIRKYFVPFFFFLLMGVNGAYLTGDLFNLYVWFEVLLCSSFVLLVLGGEKNQLRGSLKYVVINLLSSSFFLAGIALLYGKIGSLNMADIAQKLIQHPEVSLVNTSGVLLLVAFGLKAGIFPLFFWLPASYHTPPSSISALFAGLLTKVGIYSMIRANTLFLSANYNAFEFLLMGLGIATMITGVLGAAAQQGIRRILSFHIVSQIGYILVAASLMTLSGLASAIFYLVHHIVVKSNLFLLAGVIRRVCHSDRLPDIGGLLKSQPVLAATFFIPAFSLAGLPPLSGFWAKLGVLKASMESEHWLLAAAVLSVGFLTLYSMTKIWLGAFWKDAPKVPSDVSTQESRVESMMLLPCILLSLITVTIGCLGWPLYEYAERAAVQCLHPEMYIQAVLGEMP